MIKATDIARWVLFAPAAVLIAWLVSQAFVTLPVHVPIFNSNTPKIFIYIYVLISTIAHGFSLGYIGVQVAPRQGSHIAFMFCFLISLITGAAYIWKHADLFAFMTFMTKIMATVFGSFSAMGIFESNKNA